MLRTRQITIMILAVCGLFSCTTKNTETTLHKSLLGVHDKYVGEPGDPASEKQLALAESDKIQVDYHDGYLTATTWELVNACGNCYGDITTSNDTIMLHYTEQAEELCSSLDIEKVTYFIDNWENKKWVVVK